MPPGIDSNGGNHMTLAVWLAGLAALIGAALGLFSLLAPAKAAEIVRLRPDWDAPGGFAEFRATYGGLLFFAHAAVLLAIAMQAQAGMGSVIGTSFAVGAGWIGAAIGRLVAMAADHAEHRTRTGYNMFSTGFELVLGLALLAPWLGHLPW
jgi:hypothetical protein